MLKSSVSTQTPTIIHQRPGLNTSFDSNDHPIVSASCSILRLLREAELSILASVGAFEGSPSAHRTRQNNLEQFDDGRRPGRLRELLPITLGVDHQTEFRNVATPCGGRADAILHIKRTMQETEKQVATILSKVAKQAESERRYEEATAFNPKEAARQVKALPSSNPPTVNDYPESLNSSHRLHISNQANTSSSNTALTREIAPEPTQSTNSSLTSQRAQAYLANLERILASTKLDL